jgi:hypothetical protein
MSMMEYACENFFFKTWKNEKYFTSEVEGK